jgi:hypothetical protein
VQEAAVKKIGGKKSPEMPTAPSHAAGHAEEVKRFVVWRTHIHKTAGSSKSCNRVKQKRNGVKGNANPNQDFTDINFAAKEFA